MRAVLRAVAYLTLIGAIIYLGVDIAAIIPDEIYWRFIALIITCMLFGFIAGIGVPED